MAEDTNEAVKAVEETDILVSDSAGADEPENEYGAEIEEVDYGYTE